MTKRYIEKLRNLIEMLANSLTDEKAIEAPDLFPHWSLSAHYTDGDRVCYDGKLYKVLQSHDAQAT